MVKIATQIMTSELTGKPSPLPTMKEVHPKYYGVKEAVFPFNMFQEVDPVLGPEMRSTGEVLGLSLDVGEAYFKAQEATKTELPTGGTVMLSVNDNDKEELLEVAQTFVDCGFKLVATKGTCTFLREHNIPVGRAMKIQEDVPNLTHDILEGRIDLVIDTPSLKNETARADAYVRQTAIKARVPYMTTMAAAKATAEGIKAVKEQGLIGVMSLQEIHKAID